MPLHHGSDRREIGRASDRGVDDRRDVAEVVRPEDPWSDDGEGLGVDVPVVVEVVNDSARDAERLARTDVGLASVEGPGQDALQPVDRLLVSVVAVRDRHVRAGRHVELEECDRTSGRLALEQEANRQRPDPDLLVRARQHLSPPDPNGKVT